MEGATCRYKHLKEWARYMMASSLGINVKGMAVVGKGGDGDDVWQ